MIKSTVKTSFGIAAAAAALCFMPGVHAGNISSLQIQGGDFAMGAPGVGVCDSFPTSFSSFRCLTAGNVFPFILGQYQGPSLTMFNFFAAPVTTFTAADAPGALPNPTGVPDGTVSSDGVMTVDLGGWYMTWSTNFHQGTDPAGVLGRSAAATGTCTAIDANTCSFDIRWTSWADIPFTQNTYWHLTGIATIGDLPAINFAPTAKDVILNAPGASTVTWTPVVSDHNTGDVLSCAITVAPTRGGSSATVAPDCSTGTYSINSATAGPDSFVYTVTDNNSVGDPNGVKSASATVKVNPPPPEPTCADITPLRSIVLEGGGQSQSVNASLTTTFTGRITSSTQSSVKICPGTMLDFEATSSVPSASCSVNGAPVANTGSLRIGEKLICSNKPNGSDTDRFRVLEGP